MAVSVALGLLVSEITQEPWKGHVITFSEYPQLHKIEGNDLRSKTTSIRRMDWGMTTDFHKVFDTILKVAVEGKLKEDQMIKRLFVFSDMEFDAASGYENNRNYKNNTKINKKKSIQTNKNNKNKKNNKNNENQFSLLEYLGEDIDEYTEEVREEEVHEEEVHGDDWETDYKVIQKKFRKKGYVNVPEIVFWNLRDSRSTPVLCHQKGVALVSGFSKNLLKLFLQGSDLSELTPIRVMEKAISGEEYNKLVVVD
ncbi:hypothetical protein MKW92_033630 [Papaver armeniacum]|nr:hypothetical protein MKW92_033630 [Papaver armeniacum]